ncbi:histidine kinase [Streptomyces sp. 8K308]|nr:histidine kinase [Streptomyces sp. 8K308]
MNEGAAGRDGWEQRWLLPGELLAEGARSRPRRTGRDWAVDGLFFALSAAAWLLLLIDLPSRYYLPGWMVAVDPWLGAFACLALWWRREHPLAVGLALIPVTALSSCGFGAVTFGILNLGLRLPLRTALLVLVGHFVAVTPYLVEYAIPHEGGYMALSFMVAYYLFFFAWGASVRLRRQLVLRLRADARRERAEHTRRLVDARRTEREAIAREMHDVLAHRISLLSVHAGALAYRTDASAGGAKPLSDAEIGDSARVIRDTAHQALEELREVLTVLRGRGRGEEGPQPGVADIGGLVTEAERAGQRVVYTRDLDAGAAAKLRATVQRTAYRVVQEGLTNARKHAPGVPVQVAVGGAPGQGLTVAVRNALPARPSPAGIPGAGAGLAGLEERAALEGGALWHGPNASGTEFELVAELPWGPTPLGRDPSNSKDQPQLPPH